MPISQSFLVLLPLPSSLEHHLYVPFLLTATNNFDPTCFIAFEGLPTWWGRGIIENITYMRYLADKGIEPKVVEVTMIFSCLLG